MRSNHINERLLILISFLYTCIKLVGYTSKSSECRFIGVAEEFLNETQSWSHRHDASDWSAKSSQTHLTSSNLSANELRYEPNECFVFWFLCQEKIYLIKLKKFHREKIKKNKIIKKKYVRNSTFKKSAVKKVHRVFWIQNRKRKKFSEWKRRVFACAVIYLHLYIYSF